MSLKKFLSALVLSAVVFFQIAPAANVIHNALAEASPRVLRVAFPDVEGFTKKDKNGKRTGMVVDYLEEISNYTGWTYNYIDVDNMELTNEFKKGSFDLMGGNYYVESLKDLFGYPDYNMGYSKSVLLARWDDESIRSFDQRTLNGKKIGVYKNAQENIRRLKEFLALNGLACELVYYTYEDFVANGNLYPYLENGEVDLLLGNNTDIGKEFRTVVSYNSQPYYIVTRPDDTELLAELNSALEKIYDSNPNFAEECFNTYFSDVITSGIKLNKEEVTYVEEKKTVKVAALKEWYPLFSSNEADVTKDSSGILPDMLDKVSEVSGLKFEYVFAATYLEMIQAVQNGEADVLGFFSGDRETAEANKIAMTQPYATVGRTLVRNKKVSYPSEHLTAAVVEGRPLPKEIEAENLVYYSSITEALKAVDRGEVDIACGISAQIELEIQRRHFANLVPVSLTDGNDQIRFAVNKPAQTPLFTILNKVISMMTDEEKEALVNQNIQSIGMGGYSFMDFIYANPLAFLLIVIAILVLLVAIVLIFFRSRIRSATMQLELEKSHADSKAKSDFLSRMSHEIRTPMNAIIGLTDLTSRQEDVPVPVRENLTKIRSSSHYLLSLLNDILDMSRIDSGMMTIAAEPFSLSKMLNELYSMLSGEAIRHGLEFSVNNVTEHDQFKGDAIRLRQVLTNLVSNAFKFTPFGGTVTLTVNEVKKDTEEAEITFSVADTGQGIAPDDQERIFKAFEQAGTSYAKSQGTGLGLAISQNIVRLMGSEMHLTSEVGKGSEFFFTVTLPLTEFTKVQATGVDKQFLTGVRILMAEDNDLNAEIASDILEMAGAGVMRVRDGKEAVGVFTEDPSFDVVLMDIQMPVMNGLEATKVIRGLDIPSARTVPIIAMTANSFKEDTEAAMAAGMNYFIPKPIDINVLYSALAQAIPKRKN